MKLAHFVKITVFIKEEEDKDKTKQKLSSFIPFNLEEEKIKIKEQTTTSFNKKNIIIYELKLEKNRHIKQFLTNLIPKLDKQLILKQLNSRIDETCHFFLRLDKDKLLENKYEITDSGNCFHINICIAAFPAKKEKAITIVKEIFK